MKDYNQNSLSLLLAHVKEPFKISVQKCRKNQKAKNKQTLEEQPQKVAGDTFRESRLNQGDAQITAHKKYLTPIQGKHIGFSGINQQNNFILPFVCALQLESNNQGRGKAHAAWQRQHSL